MKKLTLSLLFATTSFLFINAQTNPIARSSGYSGTGANINVVYQRCNWRINPDSAIKAIGGSVTTYFKTTQSNVSSITFDLNNVMTFSATYHGSPIIATRPSTNIIQLPIPNIATLGTLDSVTVFYNGTPPAVNGQAEGYQLKSSSPGYNYIYTLSESYEDRDWWPCKADMQDKIDSMDIIISVPNGFRAASNGRFLDSNLVSGNRIFRYKSNYPIASYLVAVGVARYKIFDRGTIKVGGTNVPVWYFLFPDKSDYTTILNALDNSKLDVAAFSSVYGDYPFKNDKHGYYEFGWGGGMEHQSFSAMGSSTLTDWSIISHELMHQWFGDKVTFGTWNELWLAEGFASYGEALAAELVPALGVNAASVRSGFKSSANGSTSSKYGCYIPNSSITNSNVLWNSVYGNTVYQRGSMVVSMLRTLLGDTLFFRGMRNYLNDPLLTYGSATSGDLKRNLEAVSGGYDLQPFFDSWVYGNGYPTYSSGKSIQWWPTNSTKITVWVPNGQTKSTGSTVSYYYTPIPLRVQGAGGKDTVIVLYDQNGLLSKAGNGITTAQAGPIEFDLGFTPTTVTFDSYYMTLANGTTTKTTLLASSVLDFKVIHKSNENIAQLQAVQLMQGTRLYLERSDDGNKFSSMGEMMSQQANNYQLIDHFPLKGDNYYRVKIVLIDGNISYTNIVKVAGARSKYTLLNNPVTNTLKIKSEVTRGNALLEFTVFDLSGKKLLHEQKNINNPVSEMNVSTLIAGTYLLNVSDKVGISETIKFMIK
ncbi:MAG: M1 family aminopeptidase [Ginsengibacter sp.]